MPAEPGYRRNVCRLLAIALKREVLWNLPDEDLAIVRGRRDQVVVEWRPAKL